MRIYNTLTKKVERIKACERGIIRFYTCGPTVHDFAHIGNFRTFLLQDVFKRYLEFKGYRVIHVMNITDIDEKTIERAKRKKEDIKKITSFYAKAFLEDCKALNIKKPDFLPLTSENADFMKEIAENLVEKRYAFKDSKGNIFFDINSFKSYGKLSGKKARTAKGRKIRRKSLREDFEEAMNFAIWISADTFFPSGRPNWHIECSALALKYLGSGYEKRRAIIDIHSGGVDLIFPHHENEIAVCEALTEKKYCNYWLHIKHLIVMGKKMSKSLGNYYTLRNIIKKGYSPAAIRLALISEHYREQLDFDFNILDDAERVLRSIKKALLFLEKIEKDKKKKEIAIKDEIEVFEKKFFSALDNDFNTKEAVNLLSEFVEGIKKVSGFKISERERKKAGKLLKSMLDILGIEIESREEDKNVLGYQKEV